MIYKKIKDGIVIIVKDINNIQLMVLQAYAQREQQEGEFMWVAQGRDGNKA